MRSGNPTLNDKIFQGMRPSASTGVMTTGGSYKKTGILLLLTMLASAFSWSAGTGFIMIGFLGGFILSLVTIFKKEWASITAPLYAIFEGLALGSISSLYQMQYPGIVLNAIMLTFAVMLIMLFLYGSGTIRVTDKFRTGIIAATGAIFVVYLISMIMGFFGSSIPLIHSSGPVGIGFSVVVVGIAAFNLILDFDFIERMASGRRAPKYMEWYAAFSLMVTLIWLYIEILRLLSKLNSRR